MKSKSKRHTFIKSIEDMMSNTPRYKSLGEAKKEAARLSVMYWDTYFQILGSVEGDYTISRYFETTAIGFYLKGKFQTH